MAFSWLRAALGDEWKSYNIAALGRIDNVELSLLERILEAGVNTPMTSSCGRLFDAVSALLDIRSHSTYEGEAAQMLEMAARRFTGKTTLLSYEIREEPFIEHGPGVKVYCNNDNIDMSKDAQSLKLPMPASKYVLDFRTLIAEIAAAVDAGNNRHSLAAYFHETVAQAFAEAAATVCKQTGITTIALSGGVMQNVLLRERLTTLLQKHEYEVLVNRLAPPNDGGIALGQAVIATSYCSL
jgi:hydrogenase maturation protein HypF